MHTAVRAELIRLYGSWSELRHLGTGQHLGTDLLCFLPSRVLWCKSPAF